MVSNPQHVSHEIVAACRAGDRGAFAALVRATQDDVFTLALRLTGNAEDAQDVTQETYLRAFRAMRSFRGDASVSTWLYRIAANTAFSHTYRRGRRRTEWLDGMRYEPPDRRPESDPVSGAEQSELRALLRTALTSLPAGQRAVVVLKDVYGFSHEDIAAEIGISVSAAKVRLFRARRSLRESLFQTRRAEG